MAHKKSRFVSTRGITLISPADWLATAAQLPGKALAVALALQWLACLRQSHSVVFDRMASTRFHISRDATYDGLRRLEEAALVTVERSPGRAPTVTVPRADLPKTQ